MSEAGESDGWWWPCLQALVLGGPLLVGAISSQFYKARSSGNRPAASDTCALGTTDAASFRHLISGVEAARQIGGGSCGRADSPGQCFSGLLRGRIDALARQTGPGMEARIMAMHAQMRAHKAVLLRQSSVPPRPGAAFRPMPANDPGGRPPGVPGTSRGEVFVYALDAREVGLPGPALLGQSNARGLNFDRGRTGRPTGSYAIAEVTIVLSDPALRYPRDIETGAVEERISYIEAAWTHRAWDEGRGASSRPYLASTSVHELTSLCPVRPAWLDQPAQPVEGGGFNPAAITERSRRTLDAIQAR
ncbi:hypothetical protein [Muricoccus radiodurans]|uniref:hypothetical protein n=1 Tax=Muricoccus radiodurans TaxID=2231721 RepID=UPI003CF4AA1C